MNLITEYINKGFSIKDYEHELLRLIAEYNKIRGRYLFVYAAAVGKQIPNIGIDQNDFYTIHDMLSNLKEIKDLDLYIETPGGSGETTEEIVRFLRGTFQTVDFIIAGEAKSAGTIMALSGDNILMTKTGSLGPIDAQIRLGRSIISAHDYMEWVNNKRKEAQENKALNPFDATMVAQITPGELVGVNHSLEFARDLVQKWLINYKFKDWKFTEKRKVKVDEKMKQERAKQISRELCNHSKWRSHGRSLKADDLESIGLKITRLENDPPLFEIVSRIKTINTLLFDSSTTFKVFATQDNKIFKTATQITLPSAQQTPSNPLPPNPDVIGVDLKCPKCGQTNKLYAKLKSDKEIDDDMQKKGLSSFPVDSKLKCRCGFELDLTGLRNEIEQQTGKKVVN